MPIVKLLKGQKLEVDMIASLGKGRDHSKYIPALAFYRGYPEIKIKDAKAIEGAKVCPTDVYKVEDGKIKIIDEKKCILCMACVDATDGKIEVTNSEKDFIFFLESWGQLTSKEIIKSIRSKVPFSAQPETKRFRPREQRSARTEERREYREPERRYVKKIQHKEQFRGMLNELIGTKGSFILDNDLNILGKVPVSELTSTIKSLRNGIYAIVLDGVISKDLVYTSERIKIKYLIGTESEQVRPRGLMVIVASELE